MALNKLVFILESDEMNYTEMKKWKALRLAQEEKRNEKKKLINETNPKKLKPIKLKFKNNVEIYSYLKDGALFGFCVVKPSTSIRWHYEFSTVEELQALAKSTIIDNFKKQLAEMTRASSKITNK